MTAGDRDYVSRLGEVLRRRDPAALREFLAGQAGRFGDERQVAEIRARGPDEMEMLLHRMIVSRPDLAELHAESARWLTAHGAPSAPPGRRPRPGNRRRKPRARD
jgi:hypothetical protein